MKFQQQNYTCKNPNAWQYYNHLYLKQAILRNQKGTS